MVDAAVVLAGGAGRRLGGVDKPALLHGGRSLVELALDAVGDAVVVVVGPHRVLPDSVCQVQEDPPGAGPAAAVAAGLRALGSHPIARHDAAADATVAVLAADLPGIGVETVQRLTAELGRGGPTDPGAGPGRVGAVLLDAQGRRQYLLGVFRLGPLLAAAEGTVWAGRPLRALLDPLIDVEIPALGSEAADVDTPEDYRRWRLSSPPPIPPSIPPDRPA